MAKVDGVEVCRQDAILRPALLELPGEGGLTNLALYGLRVRQVGVLDELLRDRAGALVGPGGEAVEERAGNAVRIDAIVLVEALVLHGDDCVLHVFGDLVALDDHARLARAENGDAAWRAGRSRHPD